jgi:hypothetical protein
MTITDRSDQSAERPALTAPLAPNAPAASIGSAAQEAPAKGFAVTALVSGIVAVALALTFLFGQFGAVLGVIAVVFGFLASRKNKKAGHKRGVARAGMILGLIAIPLGFATAAALGTAVDDVVDDIDTSMTVLEAEWHLESEYTDFTNDVDATATASDVVDGLTTITVTETGTTNVLAVHHVQINDDGTFVLLD